jgi:monomeric sarcosine oxidase
MASGRVVIVGGGAIGLACAAALAQAGAEVQVLERFHHVHDLGSHGGYTRVTRQAYHEGSVYIPLVREAEATWEALERGPGGGGPGSILVRSGLVEIGPPENADLQAVFAACRANDLEHRALDAATIAAELGFRVPSSWIACASAGGGYVRVPAALDALRRAATAAGAVFRYGAQVNEVVRSGGRLRVLLESGELIPCEHVVVAAGAYLQALLPSRLRALFAVRRRVLAWTTPPEAARERLRRFPVWALFDPRGMFYGFPYGDEGIAGLKVALHVYTAPGERPGLRAEAVDREVRAEDLAPLAELLAERLPAAKGPWAGSKVCLYNCTPTGDFVVDRHPDDPKVIVAGGFSGHGFKFAPAIGRIVRGIVEGAAPSEVPEIFRWRRHLNGPGW